MASNSIGRRGEFIQKVYLLNDAEDKEYMEELKKIENNTQTSIKIFAQIEGNSDLVEEARKQISNIKITDKVNSMIRVNSINIRKNLFQIQNNANPTYRENQMKDDTCASDTDFYKFMNSDEYNMHLKDDLNRDDKPLHIASSFGKLELVKMLIEKYGDSINYKTSSGKTPLYCAANNNQLSVVKYLIENGAYIDAQTGFGDTALYTAVVKEFAGIVHYLCSKKASMNLGPYTCSVLSYVRDSSHPLDIIRQIIEKYAR